MTATRAFREKVYREYMSFFEKAECRRRWNLFNDIPWEKLASQPKHPQLADGAETFCGVEMYLPDYVAGGINIVRDSFGQAWFQANWAYEEAKHSLCLREYLLRSGQRTEADFEAFEKAIQAKTWRIPFQTARQMTCYGCLQEATTLMLYLKHQALAKQQGDEVLATIYSYIGRDEGAHAGFYRSVLKLEMEEDLEGSLRDLAHVFSHFRMPGVNLVPDYDTRIQFMRSAGVDRGAFLQVWFRLLKQLGTSRHALERARSGGLANTPSAEAGQESAQDAFAEEAKR